MLLCTFSKKNYVIICTTIAFNTIPNKMLLGLILFQAQSSLDHSSFKKIGYKQLLGLILFPAQLSLDHSSFKKIGIETFLEFNYSRLTMVSNFISEFL